MFAFLFSLYQNIYETLETLRKPTFFVQIGKTLHGKSQGFIYLKFLLVLKKYTATVNFIDLTTVYTQLTMPYTDIIKSTSI